MSDRSNDAAQATLPSKKTWGTVAKYSTVALFLVTLILEACKIWPHFWPLDLALDLFAGLTGIVIVYVLISKGTAKLDSRLKKIKVESLPLELKEIDPDQLDFFDARIARRDYRLLIGPALLEQLRVPANEARRQAQSAAQTATIRTEEERARLLLARIPPPEVLQSGYAVGKGLITAEEYNNLKNDYFAQSELSLGLILPLMFLIFAVSYHYWLSAWPRIVLVIPLMVASALLFWIGMERQHKYRMELKLLIIARWDKAIEAAAQSAAPKPKPDTAAISKIVQDELSKLKVEVKPLVVEVHTEPRKPPSSDVTPPKPGPGTGTGG